MAKTASRAKEELVAEIGAAFLCSQLGTAAGEREDHAAYCSSWLKVLKNDKRAIFRAASAAQAACDFILGLMGIEDSDSEEGARAA